MTTTEKVSKAADKAERDVLARLADRGEDAIHRLADLPGGTRAMKAWNEMRERVDDLSRKVRGIDKLEARVAKLEKEVATLKRPKPATRRSSTRKPS
jgi:ubiquinone biosynthesis protein UbiJ